MPDDKLKISWDDLSRPEVDQKVKQQELVGRAQQHYAQGGGVFSSVDPSNPYAATQVAPVSAQNLFYNSLVYMSAFGFGGGLVSWAVLEFANSLTGEDMTLGTIIFEMIAFSVIGGILSVCLSVADHVVAQNWRASLITGSVALAVGTLGGAFMFCFAQTLYSALGGGGGSPLGVQIFARAIGWSVLGLFCALAPGIVLRNGKRLLIGVAGGFLGGLLGGLLFDPIGIATSSGLLSRLVGLTAIGLLSGVGTGLIELAAKTGWLKVVAGLIAGKQFILYKNPTYLGSSPQCEIYLFKDPQVAPQHAALHQVPGGFDLEDLRSPTGTFVNGNKISRVRLKNNDLIQIGGTTLQFQEKAKS